MFLLISGFASPVCILCYQNSRHNTMLNFSTVLRDLLVLNVSSVIRDVLVLMPQYYIECILCYQVCASTYAVLLY